MNNLTKINKKIAEILVECGYCDTFRKPVNPKYNGLLLTHKSKNPDPEIEDDCEWCDPFAGTLYCRRQADAIEDYLYSKCFDLWDNSRMETIANPAKRHQWRLDRIKWCIEQLTLTNETE